LILIYSATSVAGHIKLDNRLAVYWCITTLSLSRSTEANPPQEIPSANRLSLHTFETSRLYRDGRWDYPWRVLTLLLYLILSEGFSCRVYGDMSVAHLCQSGASSGHVVAQILNYELVRACNNPLASLETIREGLTSRYDSIHIIHTGHYTLIIYHCTLPIDSVFVYFLNSFLNWCHFGFAYTVLEGFLKRWIWQFLLLDLLDNLMCYCFVGVFR